MRIIRRPKFTHDQGVTAQGSTASADVEVCAMPISPVPPGGGSPLSSQSLESYARQKNGVSHPPPKPPTTPKIELAPSSPDKARQSALSSSSGGVTGIKVDKTV
jgi:hypothetical protein